MSRSCLSALPEEVSVRILTAVAMYGAADVALAGRVCSTFARQSRLAAQREARRLQRGGHLLPRETWPRLLHFLQRQRHRVRAVSCGRRHTLFIKGGECWACGYNNKGQIRRSTQPSTGQPPVIPSPVRAFRDPTRSITIVAAGWSHSVAVTASGDMWTWGSNQFGQLGLGDTEDRFAPQLAQCSGAVTDVAASERHTLICASVEGHSSAMVCGCPVGQVVHCCLRDCTDAGAVPECGVAV